MPPFDSVSCITTREDWLREFLEKIDFEELSRKIEEATVYRKENPDWERPAVMYGIRKTHHKYIRKQEIAVIIDLMPWQERTRMAEAHWYKIIYKRPATAVEWEEMKRKNPIKRYWIRPYFIDKGWSIDKTVSHIVQDDQEEYGLETARLIKAFENHYRRKIRIYRRETVVQLNIFQ